MFATFNYDFWPTVIVTLESHIIDDDDYELFLKEWDDIYTKKTYFNFIFNTSKVGWVPLKYAFRMSAFIQKIRNYDPQYLKFSIIYVNSDIVNGLLKLIFSIQKPVAPVYIVDSVNKIGEKLDELNLSSSD